MRNNSEQRECELLAQYLTINGVMFSKISQETPAGKYVNGVWSPNWSTLRRNKRAGVNKGVPDYIIPLKKNDKYRLLFVEMKKPKGGIESVEQKKWREILNNCESVEAVVCNGFEEAVRIIKTNAEFCQCPSPIGFIGDKCTRCGKPLIL